jgi:folate-binding protein YgfZ
MRAAALPGRGVVAVAGSDAKAFLQNLVSNDVDRVGPDRSIYAALLTPQGKYLFDFFIAEAGGRLLLDCEAARAEALAKRLSMYRLRSKVELTDASTELAVWAAFGEGALAALDLPQEPGAARAMDGGVAYVDPRRAAAGARAILPRGCTPSLPEAGPDDYDSWRLSQGLPDGSADLEVEKATLVESGFEALNGVDFAKGCYVGQEVTARMKYRGLAKKRLMAVALEGEAPPPGTPILLNGREAGELRSSRDGFGLALLRLEQVEEAARDAVAMMAGAARIIPRLEV